MKHRATVPVRWRSKPPPLGTLEGPLLPRGLGRSYGDSCLNAGGVLLDTRPLNRFIEWDPETGLLRCEAGVSLAMILDLVVPAGWFLPVVPGTRWVTVGGAIANDIHGKNHHVAGTFGCHVARFELLRSDGTRVVCSPSDNTELFRATIGGLGLTGLILWAELRLQRVSSPWIASERVRFDGLDDFFRLSRDSDATWEYTVAWVDCLASGKALGRGVFFRGNHAPTNHECGLDVPRTSQPRLGVPAFVPSRVLNPLTVRAFNTLYAYSPPKSRTAQVQEPYSFFFPLDGVRHWNRLYGRRGFLQYQCVVPPAAESEAIARLLRRVATSREASFLAVLKRFGDLPSAGMLSFPRPGTTLALDLPFHGQRSLDLLDELDEVVLAAGGAVYPAKDARMPAAHFQKFFPQWSVFADYIDPKFSSSFWRRVTS